MPTTAESFSCLLRVQDQSHVPGTKVPPTSDEYVLDLVSRCEERLLKLQEELRKQAEAEHTDLEAALRQLEDEDVRWLLLMLTNRSTRALTSGFSFPRFISTVFFISFNFYLFVSTKVFSSTVLFVVFAVPRSYGDEPASVQHSH